MPGQLPKKRLVPLAGGNAGRDKEYIPLTNFWPKNVTQFPELSSHHDLQKKTTKTFPSEDLNLDTCNNFPVTTFFPRENTTGYIPALPENILDFHHIDTNISLCSGGISFTDSNNNIVKYTGNENSGGVPGNNDSRYVINEARSTTENENSGQGRSIYNPTSTHFHTVTYRIEYSQESETEEVFQEQNSVESDCSHIIQQNKYKDPYCKKFCFIIIISVTVLIGILFVIGISAYLVLLVLSNGTVSTKEQIIPVQFPSINFTHVTVGSFQEYANIFQGNHTDVEYIVSFSQTGQEKWPKDFLFNNSKNIVEINITGFFEPLLLIKVISHATNIKSLNLQNRNNTLCSGKYGKGYQMDTGLTKAKSLPIKKLSLDNFRNDCNELYNIIIDNIRMEVLEEFSLSNSVINDKNVVIIQNILRDSRYSLSSLDFINTSLTTSFFNWVNIGSMPNLTSLTFDIWKDKNASNYFENNFFTRQLPNLSRFSFGSQLRSLNESRAVYQLNNLKELKMSINIPFGVSNYSVAFLETEFPKLQTAQIYLNYESCDEHYNTRLVKYYILDLHALPRHLLKNLGIKTNGCRIFTGYED